MLFLNVKKLPARLSNKLNIPLLLFTFYFACLVVIAVNFSKGEFPRYYCVLHVQSSTMPMTRREYDSALYAD